MYSITDIARICDLSVYTIRFYDREGLLPFITRNSQGNRQFTETDLEMIKLICCLKNTGMQVKEIRQYIDFFMQGETTAPLRRQMMIDHSKAITKQINDLKKQLNTIKLKIAFYDSLDSTR